MDRTATNPRTNVTATPAPEEAQLTEASNTPPPPNAPRVFTREDTDKFLDAAKCGDEKAVRQYLSEGINVSVRNPDHHRTAVVEASRKGNYDILELLLNNGAVNDARSMRTALCASAIARQADSIKILLQYCVDPEAARNEAAKHLDVKKDADYLLTFRAEAPLRVSALKPESEKINGYIKAAQDNDLYVLSSTLSIQAA